MRKRNKQITPELKSQILVELQEPGSSISRLAKLYSISRPNLYKWRRDHGYDGHHNSQMQKSACNNNAGNFVELSVEKSDFALKKASLIFDNFSITIEGKIGNSKLLRILEILER